MSSAPYGSIDGLEGGTNHVHETVTSSEKLKSVDPEDVSAETGRRRGVEFSVEDTPPPFLCIIFAFQHYISMFIATLTVPLLLAPAICMEDDNVGKSQLIGTLFVASGLITMLQIALGVRLPIVQAGTFALLAPTLSFFELPEWKCPDNIGVPSDYNSSVDNKTYIIITGSPEHREIWMTRLRVVQGSLMTAAVVELIMGMTGAIGVLLRFIGPLAICPTVSLLGLGLFKSAADYAAGQWWICIMTLVLMVIFSQYLAWVNIPLLSFNHKNKACESKGYPLLKMFPVALSILFSWLVCFILTETNVFPEDKEAWGYKARTDIRTEVLIDSAWFRLPYPGQWGMPSVDFACVCGLLSGLVATMVESIGDYYACANLAGAPSPPRHAINRGIFVEGLGSMLDGLFGTGNGTTSTSVNVGVIGITKVGSRMVVFVAAIFMLVLGIFNKFGALFVTVPDPIIGGSFIILFGMIVAVGLSNLQYVDMNSGRNLFIVGFSIFMGLCVPQWLSNNKDAINTGSNIADSVLYVLLSTGMFVGGVLGFTLDNTIPGTEEERGIAKWSKKDTESEGADQEVTRRIQKIYDLPFGMSFIRKHKIFRYIPLCPTYGLTEGEIEETMTVQNKQSAITSL